MQIVRKHCVSHWPTIAVSILFVAVPHGWRLLCGKRAFNIKKTTWSKYPFVWMSSWQKFWFKGNIVVHCYVLVNELWRTDRYVTAVSRRLRLYCRTIHRQFVAWHWETFWFVVRWSVLPTLQSAKGVRMKWKMLRRDMNVILFSTTLLFLKSQHPPPISILGERVILAGWSMQSFIKALFRI